MAAVTSTPHPDLMNPIRGNLKCCCCGGRFEGRQFHNQDTGWGLGDCCVEYVRPHTEDMERTYGIHGVHYKLDPVARVRTIEAAEQWTDWRIAQNLSTHWGDINRTQPEQKPLDLLEGTPGLHDRLKEQMFEEDTFIVRKDGVWGILFEVEFCCVESETGQANPNDPWFANLPRYSELAKHLVTGMQAIANRFPLVQFAVPEGMHIHQGRAAAWAFVADGLLNLEQREALGRALQTL